jgi:hypothetical protein
MSYLTQNEIANNRAMLDRMSQAAAQEHIGEPETPDVWVFNNRRYWAAAPGWSEAWESAKVSHPPVEGEFNPYDPGTDEGVITDGMILSQLQSMAPATGG